MPQLLTVDSAIRPDAEDGIAVTRWLLAMISAALFLGSLPSGNAGSLVRSGLIAVGLLLSPLVAFGVRRILVALAASTTTAAMVMQLVDTTIVVAITLVASRLTPDTAWALLTVPIVIAGLRFGATGVLGTWVAVAGCQLALNQLPGVEDASNAQIFERAGTLLAVAAVVALLTSWLQAGWETQARLTSDAEHRIGYLRAVEEAGRRMKGNSAEEMLIVGLNHALRLDFEAVSAWHPIDDLIAVGNGELIPSDLLMEIKPDVIEVTDWLNESDVATKSVSVLEPQSGRVITGWTNGPISSAQIDAFGDLVAQSTSRIELGEMLRAARLEARIDPLTGLWRRHILDRYLEQISAKEGDIALLFIDLDYFKHVNDKYGHHVGDETLATAGRRLSQLIGKHGFVARYGGDEFVVLLFGPVVRFAEDIAERACAALSSPLEVDGNRIPLGATIGVATGRGPMSAALLLQQADDKVRAAKAARKIDRLSPAPPITSESPAVQTPLAASSLPG